MFDCKPCHPFTSEWICKPSTSLQLCSWCSWRLILCGESQATSPQKYINLPQQLGQLRTHVAVFFDLTNLFNSVAHKDFKKRHTISFPELLFLVTLFYSTNTQATFTTNRTMVIDKDCWRKKEQAKDAHSTPCLLHLLLHASSNQWIRAATQLDTSDKRDDGFGVFSHVLSFVDDISSGV